MGKHGSVRQEILRHFPQTGVHEPDWNLEMALYYMLWAIDDLTVDGWDVFRVVQESEDSLDAVGLMYLLPSGSVAMALNVRADETGLTWSVQAAVEDPTWLAFSASKQWNTVYLYATGARETPPWTWDRHYQGKVPRRGPIEVLEQLLGGDLPLHVIAALFGDSERSERSIGTMLRMGEIRLLDASRAVVPAWDLRGLLRQDEFWSADSGYRVEITDIGARRVA